MFEYLPIFLQEKITKKYFSYCLSLLFGLIVPLAFAPFNTQHNLFAYLIFPSLSLFFFQLLNTKTATEALLKGWLFGFGLLSMGVSWLYVAIHDFGAAHWLLAGFLTVLFISAMALYYAAFSWSIYYLKTQLEKNNSNNKNIIILFYIPVLWVLFEWLRSWLLTGFPWILAGYPLIETPLSAYAPILGIYGLSLIVAFISSLFVIRIHPVYPFIIIVLLVLVSLVIEKKQWSEVQGNSLNVALVQGNVKQSVKWDRQQLEKTKKIYTDLSQALWQDNDVIVWPENAIPVFYHTLENDFYNKLKQQAIKTQTELVVGLPVFDDASQQYYNAMTNLGEQQGFYYKSHLVPFGEYVPLASLLRGLIKFFDMPMSGFSAADSQQMLPVIQGDKVVVTLCYEDVYAQDVMKQVAQSKWMLNLSNNGWYGDSFAPHQHLEMARMRALESGRELVRSTTSGISAIIDYKGRVLVQGPQFEKAIIKGVIQPRTGMTPYAFWGNYPILLIFFIAAVFFWRKL